MIFIIILKVITLYIIIRLDLSVRSKFFMYAYCTQNYRDRIFRWKPFLLYGMNRIIVKYVHELDKFESHDTNFFSPFFDLFYLFQLFFTFFVLFLKKYLNCLPVFKKIFDIFTYFPTFFLSFFLPFINYFFTFINIYFIIIIIIIYFSFLNFLSYFFFNKIVCSEFWSEWLYDYLYHTTILILKKHVIFILCWSRW